VFSGEYERTVDAKGRLTVPSHLLTTSSDEAEWSRVMVVKSESPPCLYVYDVKSWDGILERAYREMDLDDYRLFTHRILAEAQLSDVDSVKRITIPAALLTHARIEKQAIILGVADHTEVWGPDPWNAYLAENKDIEVPSIADLSRKDKIRPVRGT
jgi:MraZ protein